MTYDAPEVIIDTLKRGEFVLIICEGKEKEGDFFVLAEAITPEKVNFLLTKAKGMICVAGSGEVMDRLQIPLMVERPEDNFGTNFTVSVDAAVGIDTGVSATDRAATIRVIGDPGATGVDLVRPGHMHPLRARDPRQRWGHTECSVELAKAAGAYPAVVICEILNEAGEKATFPELHAMAQELKIPISSLEALKPHLVS